jgi:(2Fe-2S) ferredoxin
MTITIDASVFIAACMLFVAVYGAIYRHVSKIHEKIDTIVDDVHDIDRRVVRIEERVA